MMKKTWSAQKLQALLVKTEHDVAQKAVLPCFTCLPHIHHMTTNSIARSVPARNGNKCLCGSLHMNVQATIVYNSRNMCLSIGAKINIRWHIYATEYLITMHSQIYMIGRSCKISSTQLKISIFKNIYFSFLVK